MEDFASLFTALERTTSLNDKQAALAAYLRQVEPGDGAWAVALLSGRRPKKPISSGDLRQAVVAYLGTEMWMLEEAYELVGDLGETISLLIDTLRPPRTTKAEEVPLHVWMEQRLPLLAKTKDEERGQLLARWWDSMERQEILVLQKLITGSFRVGASQTIVIRALAEAAGLPVAVVTQRMTGKWLPSEAFFRALTAPADSLEARDPAQPYPFALAYPLDTEPDSLGAREVWSAEWKWDGIRAQIICRDHVAYIWSRGEDLVTTTFPELATASLAAWPQGVVVDGEILAVRGDQVLPFAALQKRLGRKKVTPAMQAQTPVQFLAYDLLELAGEDLRERPFAERRSQLTQLLTPAAAPLGLSPLVTGATWAELASARSEARERGVEGLMLKRLDSPYRSGRKRGDWWKWKVEPLVIDAVLLYAQAGSGKRANLFTDYTLAVWDEERLVPVAKAYSGLDQGEIAELDRWIRAHTKEKFGPVRSLEPVQVFEIGFEGIQVSQRHKAGVALRFPRILRWRRDKPAAEADSLTMVKGLMHAPV